MKVDFEQILRVRSESGSFPVVEMFHSQAGTQLLSPWFTLAAVVATVAHMGHHWGVSHTGTSWKQTAARFYIFHSQPSLTQVRVHV